MIVDNFYIGSVPRLPLEAQVPLIVYADAALALAISSKSLESIAGWQLQILYGIGGVQQEKLLESRAGQRSRESSRPLAKENSFRLSVAERFYHSAENNAARY
jgi:hypothetical protein